MTATDRLDDWSVRIAESVALGETGSAVQTARAYAAGGATRRNLFAERGPAPGGMGGGAAVVLPEVLDALAYAAEALKSALGTAQLGNALSATALVLGIRAQRAANASGGAGTSPAPTVSPARDDRPPRTDSAPGGGSTAGVPQPSAAPTVEVMRAALRMSGRLQTRGVEAAAADDLAARLTVRLLAGDDPVEVAAFLDALVGGEPPRGAGARSRGGRAGLRRFTSAASGLFSREGRGRPSPDHRPPAAPDGGTSGTTS
ncbi:hypothetical protein [Streptomyces sp. NPDC127072]|uniref:hypothetical protein n=1 Tax=Streptomyces sp. NPDC127072 TaxID=3347129 RepID=UPI0036547C4F